MEDVWPSEELSRQVAIHLRGADDFPHGSIDWLAVGQLGGHLSRSSGSLGWPDTPPPRAKAALAARRAILTRERPKLRDAPVSFETLGAVYFILTAGQFRKECANYLSPRGKHRWRLTEMELENGDRSFCQVCDYCGDERPLP